MCRHRLLLIVALMSMACELWAQGGAAAPTTWGGHALPAQVPYQPTLSTGPAYTLGGEIVLPPASAEAGDPIWQPLDAGAGAAALPPGAAPSGLPLQSPLYPPTPEPSLRQSLIPPDARDGFFQKAKLTGTWLPQLDDSSLGWTDVRTEVVTALPFFTRENPIIITPSYELHFLDRPLGFDLPARLHDLAIDFHVFRVYDNRWIVDFAFTPGLYGDDYSLDSSEAVRWNGRAMGVYAPTIDWKWVLGVAYVDGGWSKVIPIAGVVYEPNADVKYEAVFPRPRVAWRLPSTPVPGRDEYWFYLLGEFANSQWAFQQSDGELDELSYRDFRAIMGLERMVVGGLAYRLEVGYVFNRDMKVASVSSEDIGLDDTFLLRAGIAY